MAKKRVVIVEDELIISMHLEILLKQWGFEIIDIITSGKEAIISINKKHPDIILLDIFLEDEIDGIEVVKEIHSNTFIPVIYITASEDPETYKRAMETSFVSYIEKPVVPDFLHSVLMNID